MVYQTTDLLPIPFLQRHNLAKKILKQAKSNEIFTGLQDFIEVLPGSEFTTYPLETSEDTFYKSLSIVIFADEIHARVIKKAVEEYAKVNETRFHSMFREEAPYGESFKGVCDYLQRSSANRSQASYIDVYVAADLLNTTIFLFETDNWSTPHSFRPLSLNQWENRGIMLSIEPTGDGHTFLFSPVVTYIRQLETGMFHSLQNLDIFDDDCEADLKYHITLLSTDKCNSISIPFLILKRFSPSLSEFIGECIETALSIEALKRFKRFLLSFGANIKLGLDFELYEFAKKWNIQLITDDISEVIEQRSIEDVVDFVNHISLWHDSDLYRHIKKRLYQAKPHELKSIRINSNSDTHNNLSEFLMTLSDYKECSKPLTQDYEFPHVVLNFNKSDKFTKYFNGEKWCPLYTSEQAKSLIPMMDTNRCCILDDTLFLLNKQNDILEIQLINSVETVLKKTVLSNEIKQPRLALCNDNATIMVMSDENLKLVCEITTSNDHETLVTDLKHVSTEDFKFRFITDEVILYSIENKQCGMTTCDSSSQNLIGIDEDRCYLYHISDRELTVDHLKSNCRVAEIPQLQSGKYLLLSRNTFEQHFSEFY